MAGSRKKSCQTGFIRRKSYTANRRGTPVHVKAACIKSTAQGNSRIKRSYSDKAKLKKLEATQKRVSKKFGTPKCKKGEIVRTGYMRKNPKSYSRRSYRRKDGTLVKAAKIRRSTKRSKIEVAPVCIKDRGLPGRGSSRLGKGKGSSKGSYKIPVILKKDVLKKYGYQDVAHMTTQARHKALDKALKENKSLPIFRRLIVISTMNKNTNPKDSRIFKDDAYWIREQYGLSSE